MRSLKRSTGAESGEVSQVTCRSLENFCKKKMQNFLLYLFFRFAENVFFTVATRKIAETKQSGVEKSINI